MGTDAMTNEFHYQKETATADSAEVSAACRETQDDIESRLSHIWQELLGIDSVGLDENYFDLGGDSICQDRPFEFGNSKSKSPCLCCSKPLQCVSSREFSALPARIAGSLRSSQCSRLVRALLSSVSMEPRETFPYIRILRVTSLQTSHFMVCSLKVWTETALP